MIRFHQGIYSQFDWQETTSGFCGVNLMQDWSYGEAKARTDGWDVERGTFADGPEIVGAAQVLIKHLPIGGGLAWVNRGPLARAGVDHYRLYQALRRYYTEERGLYLRIAPVLKEEALSEAALEKSGFRLTNARGWASAVLDLAPEIDTLRAGLRPNWRSHLNKAQRADLYVDANDSDAAYEDFLEEYENFLRDREIVTTVTADLLNALQLYRSSDAKLQYYRCGRGDIPMGSALMVRTGDTVEYLAGTLLDAGRKFSVGQLLLWRAISDSKLSGARRFDLGGMDPDITPEGIFGFKSGVGGQAYRLAPEIEAIGGGLRSALVRWRVERQRQMSVQ